MVHKVSPTDFVHFFAGFWDFAHKRLKIEGCCILNKNFPAPNYTAWSLTIFP